jgi:hypothetical protein
MPHADCAVSTIAVQLGAWTDPDIAAMVAPPVTVSSRPIARAVDPWRAGQQARSRGNMPVERHRRPAR